MPQNLDDYFVLNKYGERKPEYRVSSYNVAVADSSGPYVDNEADKYVREALKRPDAYSYENYCKNEVHLDTSRFRTVLNDSLNALQNLKRIRLGKPDSIKALLVQLQKIADKYGIDQKLNLDDLASKALKPFKSFEFKPIPSSKMDYIESRQVEHPYYFERYPFSRGFSFVEEAYHPDGINSDESLTAELYITLALGILFLCYRRFSKKVFLISLVGAIVWSIFTGLVGVSAQDEKAPMWFILFLFVLFTVMSVFLVSRRSSKTLAGVCLNWHIYVLPFLALLICGLIMSYYDDRDIPYVPNVINYEEMERKYYPVYWFVKHNFLTIAKLNILFGILYVTFVFNKLAKKWHSNPEE